MQMISLRVTAKRNDKTVLCQRPIKKDDIRVRSLVWSQLLEIESGTIVTLKRRATHPKCMKIEIERPGER